MACLVEQYGACKFSYSLTGDVHFREGCRSQQIFENLENKIWHIQGSGTVVGSESSRVILFFYFCKIMGMSHGFNHGSYNKRKYFG